MHLTRVVLLGASLLLLQEVLELTISVTGPAKTSLRAFATPSQGDDGYMSYYIRFTTYVCPQLCLRCMFVFSPMDYSALALIRFHSNLGSMVISHPISQHRCFSFGKIVYKSVESLYLEEDNC